MISNAYCKKHDEIEPENHDIHRDGLWLCPKCQREAWNRSYKKYSQDTMKIVDKALADIEKKYGSLKKLEKKLDLIP